MNNITAVRGDDYTLKVALTKLGEILDVSGWTFWFTVRKCIPSITTIDDDDSLLSQKLEIVDGSTGVISFVFTNTQFTLDTGDYYYDIQSEDDSGVIKTLITGTLTVTADITRSS